MAEKSQGPVRPPVLEGKARRAPARAARKPAGQKATPSSTTASKADEPTKAAQTSEPATKDAPKTASANTDTPKAAAPKPESSASSANASSSATNQAAKTKPRRRSADLASGLIGGLAGAVLAAIVFLLLSVWNLLPQPIPAPDTSAIENRLDALNGRLSLLEQKSSETESGLTSLDQSLKDNQAADSADRTGADDALALLDTRITDLENAPAPAIPSDLADQLASLQTRTQNLADRVDALAAGASSSDASDIAARLAALASEQEDLAGKITDLSDQIAVTNGETANLQTGLADQDSKMSDLAGQLAETNNQVSALSGRVDGLVQSAETETANQLAAQIPLALAALNDRAATGAPYADELAIVEQLLPDLPIDPDVQAAAETGLTPTTRLAEDFTRAVPAMLAAAPVQSGNSVGDQIAQSLQQIFAARNSAADDNSTAASLARIEDALNAGDVTTAAEVIGLLPEEVSAAGGDVIGAINSRATFEAFATKARAAILSDAATDPEAAVSQ